MYSRKVDGTPLTLTTSGFTYQSQHVLFDHETESFWFHLSGSNDLTCISGHYADRRLPGIASHYGPWQAWKAMHPDSKYLKPEIR